MISRARPIAVLLVVAALAGAGATGVLGGCGEPATRGAAGEALVTRVIDGDTAIVEGLGRSRLIGIDTPEVNGRSECFGAQASRFAERTLQGRRVRFEVGAEPRDRYGRALVYVWLADGRFFNELLLAQGFARTLPIAPNVRFAERFRERAREARLARRGLWSAAVCAAE